MRDGARLVLCLFGWYACSALFNVWNKEVLRSQPFPWAVSWCQLLAGVASVAPFWVLGLRAPPRVEARWVARKFGPIAGLHSIAHAAQVVGMGLGSVFMAHVVKATEPVAGTIVGIARGKRTPWKATAALVPVVAGISIAASKPGVSTELISAASIASLASTVSGAVAKALAKAVMTPQAKTEMRLDPGNTYALLTCCSCLLLAPPAWLVDGAALSRAPPEIALKLFLSGAAYYASNEFSFRVLDLLGPVPQAVANSAKRVFILLAAILLLGEAVTPRKAIGSSIALLGVLAYSLSK
ncbi:hypothetical protein CTAYLR_005543 [Chrysophaeum taylorii]|uniref:Sugar phosphate transporter domain-containing protein n=1 Tax=Chrysophaeum taylorii TaxID=2483200 RepID=A0AAD7U4P2_9STRA|nr:hypothetical protein CTAYLR_005543 [Chrysophaeum taylorii]